MATSLSALYESLDEKWGEIDILLEAARDCENDQPELYNALCRSVTVLMTAHLEGFIKDLAKAVVSDLGSNIQFIELPKVIKRTYCQKYLGIKDDAESKPAYEKKVEKLIDKFSSINCEISVEPFYYSSNKNPKPNVLKSIFKNFGIDNVFGCLHESALDEVFSDVTSEMSDQIVQIKYELDKTIFDFPYSCNQERLNLKHTNISGGGRTLWEEFLDQVNLERHKVAHGSHFDNNESVEALEGKKLKIAYLQLGLIEMLASRFSSQADKS